MKTSPIFLILLIITVCASAFAQDGPNSAGWPLQSENLAGAGLVSTRAAVDTNAVTRAGAAARLEREVFELLNSKREASGLGRLEWSDEIAAIARLHSQNMADNNFFSHRGSDGSMVDGRADKLGLFNWRAIGENIAFMRGFDDPARLALEKWMDSTAHRKNLLGTNWKESAVGVAIALDGSYYFTQVFMVR